MCFLLHINKSNENCLQLNKTKHNKKQNHKESNHSESFHLVQEDSKTFWNTQQMSLNPKIPHSFDQTTYYHQWKYNEKEIERLSGVLRDHTNPRSPSSLISSLGPDNYSLNIVINYLAVTSRRPNCFDSVSYHKIRALHILFFHSSGSLPTSWDHLSIFSGGLSCAPVLRAN